MWWSQTSRRMGLGASDMSPASPYTSMPITVSGSESLFSSTSMGLFSQRSVVSADDAMAQGVSVGLQQSREKSPSRKLPASGEEAINQAVSHAHTGRMAAGDPARYQGRP